MTDSNQVDVTAVVEIERYHNCLELTPDSYKDGWRATSIGNVLVLVHYQEGSQCNNDCVDSSVTVNCAGFNDGCIFTVTMTLEAPHHECFTFEGVIDDGIENSINEGLREVFKQTLGEEFN